MRLVGSAKRHSERSGIDNDAKPNARQTRNCTSSAFTQIGVDLWSAENVSDILVGELQLGDIIRAFIQT